MMSWIGSWFLTLGASVLVFVGVIFDWLVKSVIIDFAGTLTTTGTMSAINTGWTVFRDLANIAIIGMFTFIAIATILGINEYGYRKLLSKVLIVAILINFSLLFSKIIIDTGNVIAYELYKQTSQSLSTQANGTQTFDIAGAFMQPLGITSVWDTTGVVKQFGINAQSGVQAFAFGLIGGLLLIGLAIVLLYGCFLIATRAILLIVLMLTASIAFMSHLIPKFSDSNFGWSGWWRSLIGASFFAPILMIFLYITLMILKGSQAAMQNVSGQSASIGSVLSGALSNPGQAVSSTGWTVIILYIFGIGMLFVSFRLSSAFASSISGLNLGQYAFDLGRSRLGGLAWQQTVGRFSFNRQKEREYLADQNLRNADKARRSADIHLQAGNKPLADFAQKEAERLRRDAAKNQRGANFYGGLANKGFGGVQGYGGGLGKPGNEETKGAQSHAANAGQASATPMQQNPQMDELVKQQRELNASIAAGEKDKQQVSEQLKQLASSNKEFAEAQKTIASDAADRKQIEDKHSEEMVKKQIESANSNMDANKRAQQEYDLRRGSEDQRASELRHQNEKIEQATQQIKQITENDPQALALQKHLKEVDEKLGLQRSQAQGIDQKIQSLQNNAPTAGTPPMPHEPATASIATNNNEDVFAASRGRTLRAEVFRPNTTDVAMHTDAIVHDRPLPGQQNAA